MNATQTHLVRKSFGAVERQPDVAALVFYRRLFELAPGLRPLFKSDIEAQAAKLMETLAVALNLLDRPAELAGELEVLGAKHVEYGARTGHYAIVRRALLDMFAEVLGGGFTPEVRAAWDELYDFIEAAMLRGAATAERNLSAVHTARRHQVFTPETGASSP
jgi:hemoglobin-like flavoprotein